MRRRIITAGLAALVSATGCLGAPDLKDCSDFAIGTEGCGSGCEIYCDLMTRQCSGVFESMDRCMNDCANEPVTDFSDGDLGDEEGNTLSCRITYAKRGACGEAALLGTEQCVGASCEDYCALMMNNCDGAYPSQLNCEETCAMLPRGTTGVDENSVECRFGYAERAATDPSACEAASLNGGGVCGDDPCVPYCDLLDLNCTGANQVYESRSSCLFVCSLMDTTGSFDDWDFSLERDTVQCRSYHAGPPAKLEPETHCPHTRVYNDEHCGIDPGASPQPEDWPCISYCNLVLLNCPTVYGDLNACRSDCATFPEVMTFDPESPGLYPISMTTCPM